VAVVAVLGASGVVGGRVAAAAEARGLTVARPAALPEAPGPVSDVPDVADGETVVVVDATSATGDARRATVRAAAARGWTVLDLSLDPAHLAWLVGGHVPPSGRVVVGAGMLGLVGDLLAASAAPASGTPVAVHVTYALPDRGGLRGATTPGLQRAIADWLTTPISTGVEDPDVDEVVGERRRLAWFPRPVGPVHAAGIPAPERWTVPLHLDVPMAMTSLALPSWRAERLQAAANASGWPVVGPRLVRRVVRSRPEPGPTLRATTRWACVAEVEGSQGVARGWAYGRGPLGTAVIGVVAVLERLTEDGVLAGLPTGALAPAQLGPPGALLDTVSVASDLRWSVTRP
jgi:hypothetical protein